MFSKSRKAKGPRTDDRTDDRTAAEKLPIGAEAAIWSILEVIPDPRNHLALTRDPTAEIRLSPAAISEAMAMATVEPPEPIATGSDPSPVLATTARPRSSMDLDFDQIQVVAPAPSTDLRTDPAELAWVLNHNLDRLPTRLPRPAGIRWSADTAEVRLPSLSAPQTAKPAHVDEPTTLEWPGDVDRADATVHPIDPSTASPDDAKRYARGA